MKILKILTMFMLATAMPSWASIVQKINKPLPAGPLEAAIRSSAQLGINGRSMGSGLYASNARGQTGVFTAWHVVREICGPSLSLMVEVRVNERVLHVPCGEALVSASHDYALLPLPVTAEDLGVRPIEIKNGYLDTGTRFLGQTYCALSTAVNGEATRVYSNGRYLIAPSENLPGCSGSALLKEGAVIGLHKGFKLENRESIFTPLDPYELLIRPTEDRRLIASKGRGDPLDGDNQAKPSMVHVMPLLGPLPYLATNRRILHIPDQPSDEWIAPQTPSLIGRQKVFSSRIIESEMPNASFKMHQPKSRVALDAWDFDFGIFNRDFEIQLWIEIEKQKGSYSVTNHLPTENRPFGRLDFLSQPSGFQLEVPVETPKWRLKLNPGKVEVEDRAIGAAVFLHDPNATYRDFFIRGETKVVLYSIEIHAYQDKGRFFEMVVTRAEAESEALLRQGDLLKYDFMVITVKDSPFKANELGR